MPWWILTPVHDPWQRSKFFLKIGAIMTMVGSDEIGVGRVGVDPVRADIYTSRLALMEYKQPDVAASH